MTGREFFEIIGDWFAGVFEWHRLFFSGEVPLLDLPVGIILLMLVYLVVIVGVITVVLVGLVHSLWSSGPSDKEMRLWLSRRLEDERAEKERAGVPSKTADQAGKNGTDE